MGYFLSVLEGCAAPPETHSEKSQTKIEASDKNEWKRFMENSMAAAENEKKIAWQVSLMGNERKKVGYVKLLNALHLSQVF